MTAPIVRAVQAGSAIAAAATILLFAAFLANVALPTTIDGARGASANGNVARDAAIDAALVALFALQHSAMARRSFKRASARLVPPALERSVYLLAASAALLAVIAAWRPIPDAIWDVRAPAARAAVLALFAVGWIVLAASTAAIDARALAGLRGADPTGAPPSLRVVGLHRFVRHPTYAGWLLVFWAAPTMSEGRLLFAALMTAYVLAAIPLEERDLARAHGAAYARYRRAVPMLIPWKGIAHARVTGSLRTR